MEELERGPPQAEFLIPAVLQFGMDIVLLVEYDHREVLRVVQVGMDILEALQVDLVGLEVVVEAPEDLECRLHKVPPLQCREIYQYQLL
jgi:hypothetical protein